MQAVELDKFGVARFRPNALVQYLLDHGGIDMNTLAALPGIHPEDREQFVQLIGYSVSGFCELSYVSRQAIRQATHKASVVEVDE